MNGAPRMTRSAAREIAVHLIYAVQCTGEDPRTVLDSRFEETYYSLLSGENDVYAERPKGRQRQYIDSVVEGVCARREELEGYLSQYSIGWNVSRISRLARAIIQIKGMVLIYN